MQKTLLFIGLAFILIALTWPWLKHIPLGRLPGDIVVQRPNFTFFFPITSMILVSLVLSGIAYMFRK